MSEQDIESAIEAIRQEGKASTSFLQRRLRWGYVHAKSVLDELAKRGFVKQGEKPHLFEPTESHPMTNQPAPSDTPLVDAEVAPNDPTGSPNSYVTADFARELERTIARLSAERDDYKLWYSNTRNNYDLLKATLAERDKQLAEAELHIGGQLACIQGLENELAASERQKKEMEGALERVKNDLRDERNLSDRLASALIGESPEDKAIEAYINSLANPADARRVREKFQSLRSTPETKP